MGILGRTLRSYRYIRRYAQARINLLYWLVIIFIAIYILISRPYSYKVYEVPRDMVDLVKSSQPWYYTNNQMIEDIKTPSSKGMMKHILWPNPPSWEVPHLTSPDIISGCPIKDCRVHVSDGSNWPMDAVVYSAYSVPMVKHFLNRLPNQLWVFYTMEPPYLSSLRTFQEEHWLKQFNLTMTYRLDSDIIVNYGNPRKKTIQIQNIDFEEIFSRKNKMVAVVISHCHTPSRREWFIKQLTQYISVDVYGGCGQRTDDPKLFDTIERDYKFYLAFENGFCKDYVTEKFFRVQSQNIIAVVRGGAVYSNFYPPDTFINTEDFRSVQRLAEYLTDLSRDRSRYMEYLKLKSNYDSTPGNVYIAMCDLCKILHTPQRQSKVYWNIYRWFTHNVCWAPIDI